MHTPIKQANRVAVSRRTSLLTRYRVELAILVGGLIAMNAIFLAEAFRATDTVTAAGAGQLGDFVGGYVGTFFALASVVLLTATLRSQRRSSQLLNFEAKYFELLRLHRDNVSEFDAQGVIGRRLFVAFLREFRAALDVLRPIAQRHEQHLSQSQLVHIAYYSLFYGTGPNSSRMLSESLAHFNALLVTEFITVLNDSGTKGRVQREQNLAYVPFEGHQSRLGHYYRHLYQAVGYVDQQELDIDKYEYVKTIRAQLSNQEQALLLLNSLTPLGENWLVRGFITRYKLVKNIPRNYFDSTSELDLSSLFSKGYFEWEST